MELFNSKLYAKYQELKKRNGYIEEELNNKVDADLRGYQVAAEDFMDELRKENDRLRAEISFIQEQFDECQKLLLEERRKNENLVSMVGRLEGMLAERNSDKSLPDGPQCPQQRTKMPSLLSSGKRKRSLESTPVQHDDQQKEKRQRSLESTPILHDDHQKEATATYSCSPEVLIMPACCKGGVSSGKERASCVFQTLIEFLVGMKFSIDHRTEGLCLSVNHQKSGYTFNLTWLGHEDGCEGELVYRMSTLGTLERVALDWMKEEIVFSMTMSRVFFDRISKVTGPP